MPEINDYIETLRSVASRHNEVAESVRIAICADKLEEEIFRLQHALKSIASAYPCEIAEDMRRVAHDALPKHLR
jgi:hypothetical protein